MSISEPSHEKNGSSGIELVLKSIEPVYASGLEDQKIIDHAANNQQILTALESAQIPIVENFAKVSWHFGNPPQSGTEAKAVSIVGQLAGKGILDPYIRKIGKREIRYLYWESKIYDFPFGAVINGRVCCYFDENRHWLLDFQKRIICTVEELPQDAFPLEDNGHLLFSNK